MAHDERRVAPARRSIPTVDVAAANSAGANPHDDFILRRSRIGKIDELEFRWRGEEKGLHGLGRVKTQSQTCRGLQSQARTLRAELWSAATRRRFGRYSSCEVILLKVAPGR